MSRRDKPGSPFVAPAWISLITLIGLVSALLGDGLYDVVSWLVFAGLIALVVYHWMRRDRSRGASRVKSDR